MEIRNKIIETLRVYDDSTCPPECSPNSPCQACAVANIMADAVISEALTLPLVELPCQDCGGSGRDCCIEDTDCDNINHDNCRITEKLYYPSGGYKGVKTCKGFLPCTCQNGKRAYRIMWRQPFEEGDITDYDKPLSLLDLQDADVREALHVLDKWQFARPGEVIATIPNNKGRLVLMEENNDMLS